MSLSPAQTRPEPPGWEDLGVHHGRTDPGRVFPCLPTGLRPYPRARRPYPHPNLPGPPVVPDGRSVTGRCRDPVGPPWTGSPLTRGGGLGRGVRVTHGRDRATGSHGVPSVCGRSPILLPCPGYHLHGGSRRGPHLPCLAPGVSGLRSRRVVLPFTRDRGAPPPVTATSTLILAIVVTCRRRRQGRQ